MLNVYAVEHLCFWVKIKIIQRMAISNECVPFVDNFYRLLNVHENAPHKVGEIHVEVKLINAKS